MKHTGAGKPRASKLCDTVSHRDQVTSTERKPAATDARAARTDQVLCQALLSLLEREPLEAITIRQICAEAGVHYATFFRHHASKEALLDHLARDQIDHLMELALSVSDTAGDRAGYRALVAYVDEHRTVWSALLTGGAGAAMRGEFLRIALTVAAERAPEHSWLPVELATTCTVSLMIETIAWWLQQTPDRYSVDEVASMLYRLLYTSTLIGGNSD